ncbi:hypothetical protein [Sporomusa sp. KB1]|jgi:hypothetical protein|uniref:hypothetical protein n=1 Tax=Sporomusa sp. KB1 TaxID=943346 RepID=UPI0011A57FE0|nr:hypothetical protein [Sporomusa sp. KB1]
MSNKKDAIHLEYLVQAIREWGRVAVYEDGAFRLVTDGIFLLPVDACNMERIKKEFRIRENSVWHVQAEAINGFQAHTTPVGKNIGDLYQKVMQKSFVPLEFTGLYLGTGTAGVFWSENPTGKHGNYVCITERQLSILPDAKLFEQVKNGEPVIVERKHILMPLETGTKLLNRFLVSEYPGKRKTVHSPLSGYLN